MKATVFESRKAPKWIKIWNIINGFIAAVAIITFIFRGFIEPYTSWFTAYVCLYFLIIGQLFIPKKYVDFPQEMFRKLSKKFSKS